MPTNFTSERSYQESELLCSKPVSGSYRMTTNLRGKKKKKKLTEAFGSIYLIPKKSITFRFIRKIIFTQTLR